MFPCQDSESGQLLHTYTIISLLNVSTGTLMELNQDSMVFLNHFTFHVSHRTGVEHLKDQK